MMLSPSPLGGLCYTPAPSVSRIVVQRARVQSFKGGAAPLTADIKVVGCGSCGVDYLASVAAFPQPDQKLRTDTLEVQGGGNCANALTAAARLGLKPWIVTKIGGDGLGDGIISELQADGVGTQLVLRAAGQPSPFTYIIVDRAGGTRTCIHTPGEPLQPEEMTPQLIASALDGAALVYFDGRLTEAALLLAAAARQAGVAVLVEGERLRPGLQDLLQLADYVVTSAHFPQEWTGEQSIGDALLEVAARLPRARLIFTTRGTKGSVCLMRQEPTQEAPAVALQDALDDLYGRLAAPAADSSSSGSSPGANGSSSSSTAVCVSSSGIEVQPAAVVASPVMQLQFSSRRDPTSAQAQAAGAAAKAAAMNADGGNAAAYSMAQVTTQQQQQPGITARVFVASAAGLPQSAVADTTGAGDAFIGSVVTGLVTGLSPERIMALGAVVAACKCTLLGARPGLPHREQLASSLLE